MVAIKADCAHCRTRGVGFPDDTAAEKWFVETRWPDGVHCPKCGSDNVQERPTRIHDYVKPGARVYTDDNGAYTNLAYDHTTVQHKRGKYVDGDAHTNGIESFWSMLKRAHKGTYHKMSPKYLNRYVTEFSGQHNQRGADTIT